MAEMVGVGECLEKFDDKAVMKIKYDHAKVFQ